MSGAPRLERVAAVLEEARQAGVAPALSALVLRGGAPVHASLHGSWSGGGPAAARPLRSPVTGRA